MAIVPIFFLVLAVPLGLILLAAFAALVFKLLFGAGRRGTGDREAAMRQLERTWMLLEKMENRITNLETILIERGRPMASSDSKREPGFHA